MKPIDRDEILALARHRSPRSVSIYLPTHTRGAEVEQDHIRLRNLLDEIERELVASGVRAPEARDQLAPARALCDDAMFWRTQSDGLAIFLTPNEMRTLRAPMRFPMLGVVGERLHLRPLAPALSGDGDFFLLHVGKSCVRLYRGTRDGMSEVDLHKEPERISELLSSVLEPIGETHFRIVGKGYAGRPSTMVQGAGSGPRGVILDEKVRVREFFDMIDRALRETVLRDRQEPLVLAGVEYLLPIYRAANSYRHLADRDIPRNVDVLDERELHRRAWEIVAPTFTRDRDRAARACRDALGTGLATVRVEEAVRAAAEGRVGVALLTGDREVWGSFENGDVRVHRAREIGDEDLLNRVMLETLKNGGEVFSIAPEEAMQMRLACPILAMLRY